jgi:hypothetical protein
MARIKTYIVDANITDNDIVIGSDADNSNETKNFNIGGLREYILSGLDPEVGGNLKITTIVDNDSLEVTPEDYFNNSVSPIIVLHYEIVFLILNGRTYIFRKNNDVYGVGETQVVSGDFTEIDITSVINANLQDLDSVLNAGNESILDAKIGALNLWDSTNSSYGGVNGYDDKITFIGSNTGELGNIGVNELVLLDSNSAYKSTISVPTISANRTATLQNKDGTIAYIDDIPSVPIQSLIEGDNITITEDSGDFTISSTIYTPVYVLDTELRDSVSNTTFFNGGGEFSYDASLYDVNSIGVTFNNDVELNGLIPSGDVFARMYIQFENGVVNAFEVLVSDVTINSNYVSFDFPLATYWSNLVGERIALLDITIKPKAVSLLNGTVFDGSISNSVSKYYTKLS